MELTEKPAAQPSAEKCREVDTWDGLVKSRKWCQKPKGHHGPHECIGYSWPRRRQRKGGR